MPNRGARLCGAIFAALALGGASGCSASVSVRTSPTTGARSSVASRTAQPQRPGTCEFAPPHVNVPTGEWTSTETVLTTNDIDACAGERTVRPLDFRHVCNAGTCKTYLYSISIYGPAIAKVTPDGRERYLATFQSSSVPCPHRPGEDAGMDRGYSTMTLSWSSHRRLLHGVLREYQVGPCGGGPPTTSSYVAVRTNPAANPPAEGP
jgi:hypothetical protein